MGEYKQVLLLILILTVVVFSSIGITNVLLLRNEFDLQRERLVVAAKSHARLMETIARFHARHIPAHPGGAFKATLSQIADTRYQGFGETGEFILACRKGNLIEFLVPTGHQDQQIPKSVPFTSEFAEPMRQALLGKSGTLVGPDYRGVSVLAAYEPVAELNLGLVVKIDLAEIRDPFMRTAILSGSISIIAILVGTLLFFKITNPMIRRIHESEDLMNKSQKLASIGSWQWGVHSDRVFWSDEMFRIYGLEPSPDHIVTFDLARSLVHPTDLPTVRKNIEVAVETGKIEPLEYRLLLTDGTSRNVRREFDIEFDKNGKPAVMLGTLQDITARKKSQDALEKSEEMFRSITTSAQDAIIIMDSEGKITFWNESAERMFYYTSEEAQGKELHRLIVSDENHQAFLRGFGNFLETGQGAVIGKIREMEGIRKDGTEFPLELSVSSVNLVGQWNAVGIIRDNSGRKKLEAQLNAAMRMETVGRLAGGMAHDFNNILSVIGSYSGFLLEQFQEGDQSYEDVRVIRESTDRAAGLTRQLLAFSRRQVMRMEVTTLNRIVQDMEKMLSRLIGEDIHLVSILADNLGQVTADVSQIEQIIMNLAVNARDAMPNGGELSIETANVTLDEEYAEQHVGVNPGDFIMLAVSDNGTGMDEETRSKVFEPFFTTKEVGKGTGLGLSTVYGIVKQMNGNIWVYSELGLGTTFKVYLPRIEGEEIQERQHSSTAEQVGDKETILLVEDEELVRQAARRILENHGYTILEAPQGVEALDLCRKHGDRIQLLLTDVIMPLMNGRELAKQVESMCPHIRILYMSGYTDNSIAHYGVLEEGVALLQKPFSKESLLGLVRKVLDTSDKQE